MEQNCIFCKIIAGEMPADQVYKDELVTAFRDIHPQAPTHILIVPNMHFESLAEMGDDEAEILGRVVEVANHLAEQEGVLDSGYRFVTNVGPDAGQAVFHTHFHLIGGRPLGRMVKPLR
ncbi:MAG: histidine triad nucleotide-binding protein [Caldilineae bacterium]|nr:MAG: histidine triad nucleotide-binding protein [Caldilineae bacterium]